MADPATKLERNRFEMLKLLPISAQGRREQAKRESVDRDSVWRVRSGGRARGLGIKRRCCGHRRSVPASSTDGRRTPAHGGRGRSSRGWGDRRAGAKGRRDREDGG